MTYKVIDNFLNPEEYKNILWAIKTGKKNSGKILPCHKGIENRAKSFTFGYRPPQYNKLKTQMPSRCALYRTNPKNNFILESITPKIESEYKRLFPKAYELHRKDAENILSCWRINDSIYTQGIVNVDNQLKKHRDRGNTDNCISAMLTFKKNCTGGDLVVDDEKLQEVIENDDNSLLFFNGKDLAHYVNNFSLSGGGYRYTIVFYTHKAMIGLLRPKEELIKSQQKRRLTEKKRYGL